MKVIAIQQPWAYLASVGLFRPSIPVESRDIRNSLVAKSIITSPII